jgi:hypothetical protein
VRALPLAAGINEGGHYFRYFFLFLLLFLLPPLLKTAEGVIEGFQIFAWAPKKNIKNYGKKINSYPHPLAPWGRFLGFFRCFFFKL